MNAPQRHMNAPQRRTVNVRELAARLGCSAQTVYESIKAGRIQACRIGPRRVVVPRSVAEELLQEPWDDGDGGRHPAVSEPKVK